MTDSSFDLVGRWLGVEGAVAAATTDAAPSVGPDAADGAGRVVVRLFVEAYGARVGVEVDLSDLWS